MEILLQTEAMLPLIDYFTVSFYSHQDRQMPYFVCMIFPAIFTKSLQAELEKKHSRPFYTTIVIGPSEVFQLN